MKSNLAYKERIKLINNFIEFIDFTIENYQSRNPKCRTTLQELGYSISDHFKLEKIKLHSELINSTCDKSFNWIGEKATQKIEILYKYLKEYEFIDCDTVLEDFTKVFNNQTIKTPIIWNGRACLSEVIYLINLLIEYKLIANTKQINSLIVKCFAPNGITQRMTQQTLNTIKSIKSSQKNKKILPKCSIELREIIFYISSI